MAASDEIEYFMEEENQLHKEKSKQNAKFDGKTSKI